MSVETFTADDGTTIELVTPEDDGTDDASDAENLGLFSEAREKKEE